MKIADWNRYWAVLYDSGGRDRYWAFTGDEVRYAVLDLKSMVCEWVFVDEVNKKVPSYLNGLHYDTGKFYYDLDGTKYGYNCISSLVHTVSICGKGFTFRVVGGFLCLGKTKICFCGNAAGLEFCLLSDSSDGVWRLGWGVVDSGFVMEIAQYITVWLDVESQKVLGYQDCFGDMSIKLDGLAQEQVDKWQRFLGRRAKVDMLGGRRLY